MRRAGDDTAIRGAGRRESRRPVPPGGPACTPALVTTSPSPNPWIAYRAPRPNARVRLLCFPYAGGAASLYRGWADGMPSEIEVLPVQPPGRESRLREPSLRDMDSLADALERGLAAELDRGPYALFGHSLGALSAYELARRRRDAGRPEPVHLLVSAHSAPQLPWEDEPLHDMPSDRFRERLRELQGTPAEVLDHPELMELVEPMLRADFQLNETYRHRPGPPLTCPITAFGGVGDEDVPRRKLEPWAELTRGPFRLETIAGGHFFLHTPGPRAELLRQIAEILHRA